MRRGENGKRPLWFQVSHFHWSLFRTTAWEVWQWKGSNVTLRRPDVSQLQRLHAAHKPLAAREACATTPSHPPSIIVMPNKTRQHSGPRSVRTPPLGPRPACPAQKQGVYTWLRGLRPLSPPSQEGTGLYVTCCPQSRHPSLASLAWRTALHRRRRSVYNVVWYSLHSSGLLCSREGSGVFDVGFFLPPSHRAHPHRQTSQSLASETYTVCYLLMYILTYPLIYWVCGVCMCVCVCVRHVIVCVCVCVRPE